MADIVELFAGCGGLSLGAIQAGHTIVRAYDFDAAACEAYPHVTGHRVIERADLTQFDLNSLPDAVAIIGGPPCQDFSSAGHNQGAVGNKNLWPVAVAAVRIKRPDWFLFENVSGLVEKKHRPYFDSLLWKFRDLGYIVDWRLLNAADYGVPQTRERVFVVGWRDSRRCWTWPEPTHCSKDGTMFWRKWVSAREALGNWLAGEKELMPAPPSVTKRYPSGLPDDSQILVHTRASKLHRSLDEPGFTVTFANHSFNRIQFEGKTYRLDNRACAILQTLPSSVANKRCIANAVPPLLARALLSEVA